MNRSSLLLGSQNPSRAPLLSQRREFMLAVTEAMQDSHLTAMDKR